MIDGTKSYREQVSQAKREIIRRALDAHGWRKAETARALQMSREGLWKLIVRLRIER